MFTMFTIVVIALSLSAMYNLIFLGCLVNPHNNLTSKIFVKVIPILIGILCLIPLIDLIVETY